MGGFCCVERGIVMTLEERIAKLEEKMAALEQSTRPIAVTAEMIFAGQLAPPTSSGQLQLLNCEVWFLCN